MTPQEEDKKNELKKLFYSNLSSYEIQSRLSISQNEYNKLLSLVKQELGLPTNYKRIPSRMNEYSDGKYAIFYKHPQEDDWKIVSYSQTEEYAENLIEYYKEANHVDGDYWIEQATEEHMLDLIENDYFNNEQIWNNIMIKYKLSYHSFYKLLNKVKERKGLNGVRTGSNMRYIYFSHNNWVIRKSVDGVQKDYGIFKDLDTAIRIRDYLESINWNYETWKKNKDGLVEAIIV